jgi:hypothetical protein
MEMGHMIRIKSKDQYVAATSVLDFLPGTWHSRGPSEAAVLFVTDDHYKALIKAAVVSANGNEGKGRGKKAAGKKANS